MIPSAEKVRGKLERRSRDRKEAGEPAGGRSACGAPGFVVCGFKLLTSFQKPVLVEDRKGVREQERRLQQLPKRHPHPSRRADPVALPNWARAPAPAMPPLALALSFLFRKRSGFLLQLPPKVESLRNMFFLWGPSEGKST